MFLQFNGFWVLELLIAIVLLRLAPTILLDKRMGVVGGPVQHDNFWAIRAALKLGIEREVLPQIFLKDGPEEDDYRSMLMLGFMLAQRLMVLSHAALTSGEVRVVTSLLAGNVLALVGLQVVAEHNNEGKNLEQLRH